ncbi:MAG: histidine phosphatase family protein [Nocardioidaceae bacterium]
MTTPRIGGRAPDAGPPCAVRARQARLDCRRQGLSRTDAARPRPGTALRRRLVRAGVREDVLLSSTVRRARETASLLSPAALPAGGRIRLDPNLCEPHPGEGDGLTRAEFAPRYGAPDSLADPDRPWAPGGESWNDFVRRVRRAIGEIPTRYPHQTVLAVTHAGLIVQFFLSLVRRIRLGRPRATGPRLCRHHRVGVREAGRFWRLIAFNDTAHLSTAAWSEASG